MGVKSVLGKARDIVSLAGKKTGNAVEVSKLNIALMQRKSMLQSTFERIGSLYYLKERKELTGENTLLEICLDEVDSLSSEIASLTSEIELITKGKICTHCGFRNEASAFYCSSCGLSIE